MSVKGKQTIKDWISQEQGKHFCQCNCGQEIIIKKHHLYHGVPKYIAGHQPKKEWVKDWVKENQGKHFCQCGCGGVIKIKKQHHRSSIGIPKYILFHHKNEKHFKKETVKRMVKSEGNDILLEDWVVQEQGKYFCHCGCNGEIKIIPQHYYVGIPKFINHHHVNFIIHKKWTKEMKENSSVVRAGKGNSFYGKHHTKETKEKLSKLRSKENNFNWQGMIVSEYCEKFNNECKESNRNKYNRKCFLCGKLEEDNLTKSGRNFKLDVHHIDYNKQQGCNSEWKLVPLCRSCHMKTGAKSNRNYYEWLITTMLYIREMIIEYKGKIDYRSLL